MKSRRIFAAFVTLVYLCGCRSGKNKTVPDELVGVWKTSAPNYADRSFELKKDAIIFGTGEGKVSFNTILQVEEVREEKEKMVLYVIHYTGEGGNDYALSLYYDATNGGTIRFKNQMQIEWTKAA
jgi:hypothetical protein